MIRIDAADGCDDVAVERLQPRIEVGLVTVGRDRFVEQIVAEDGRLVVIVGGELAP